MKEELALGIQVFHIKKLGAHNFNESYYLDARLLRDGIRSWW